eukprot:89922-Pyramimonas_sp.AAC.1
MKLPTFPRGLRAERIAQLAGLDLGGPERPNAPREGQAAARSDCEDFCLSPMQEGAFTRQLPTSQS